MPAVRTRPQPTKDYNAPGLDWEKRLGLVMKADPYPSPIKNMVYKAVLRYFNHKVHFEYMPFDDLTSRIDIAFPEEKIAIEYEGGVNSKRAAQSKFVEPKKAANKVKGGHRSSKTFLHDVDKYNNLAMIGWRVYRCTAETDILKFIKDIRSWIPS